MANEPDPSNDNVPDAEELADELGLDLDSDDAPDGSVDPDDMKNPDRSDEGRRRRETGSDPDEGLGGMEAAKRLYGGESDPTGEDTPTPPDSIFTDNDSDQ
jgi:hypothetical protein